MWTGRLSSTLFDFLARKVTVLAVFVVATFSMSSQAEQQNSTLPSVDLYNLSLEELMDIEVDCEKVTCHGKENA